MDIAISRVGIRPQLQVLASVRFLAFVGFGFPGSFCSVCLVAFPGPGPLSALSCPAGLVLLCSWSVSFLGLVFVRLVLFVCWPSVLGVGCALGRSGLVLFLGRPPLPRTWLWWPGRGSA